MSIADLRNRLLASTAASDFASEAASIIECLEEEGAGLEAVGVILQFMEDHSTIDFGAPGPLVHFVERFYGRGYEAELLGSIARKPTSHTVWMLNRIINGTKNPTDREKLINVLRQAGNHPGSDSKAKQQTASFLQHLSS